MDYNTKEKYMRALYEALRCVHTSESRDVLMDIANRVAAEQPIMNENEFNEAFTLFITKEPKSDVNLATMTTTFKGQVFLNGEILFNQSDFETMGLNENELLNLIRPNMEKLAIRYLNETIEKIRYREKQEEQVDENVNLRNKREESAPQRGELPIHLRRKLNGPF